MQIMGKQYIGPIAGEKNPQINTNDCDKGIYTVSHFIWTSLWCNVVQLLEKKAQWN